MGIGDQIKDAAGKAKEAIGEKFDNEKLANEGKADQVEGQTGQAVDDAKAGVKEAYDKAAAAIKDATDGK